MFANKPKKISRHGTDFFGSWNWFRRLTVSVRPGRADLEKLRSDFARQDFPSCCLMEQRYQFAAGQTRGHHQRPNDEETSEVCSSLHAEPSVLPVKGSTFDQAEPEWSMKADPSQASRGNPVFCAPAKGVEVLLCGWCAMSSFRLPESRAQDAHLPRISKSSAAEGARPPIASHAVVYANRPSFSE